MPHHPAHCQTTLRRAGTLVFSLPRKRICVPSLTTYKPLLPFLWPHTSLARTHSTTATRRSRDPQHADMGKEGKGNFQLKTPKGTRDCTVAASALWVWKLTEWQGRAPMLFCANRSSRPLPMFSSTLQPRSQFRTFANLFPGATAVSP